ncbi:mannitol dehydrogenase family protein [uncultured Maricaulis sp.]|uniref:mannitol dehydrogenase family protein n=1 Tax=uncultured Maricaulis sp. TaxID=174710 RepID=UPI0025F60EE3|nr:mannitol dehydrogenase family protein [uncultured Maricaulis sp.]
MKLNHSTLDRLPADARRPDYIPSQQACGIVHLGVGAFHRAHQAVYTDAAMNAGERNWRIMGVSLRSRSVRDQLSPQDGLYTVSTKSEAPPEIRVIGAIADVLVAPENPAAVIEALASTATRIVTLTVTEKGYHQSAGGGLDMSAPAIAADLARSGPTTIFGFLAAGLHRRRQGSAGGLTLLSCDNMADNGKSLARSLDDFLEQYDPTLADWTRHNCSFPSSMVDRIVPATTDADRRTLSETFGLEDAGAVFTEPFSQWVIEDDFVGPRPGWEQHGAELVSDVAPYETAKLRMLNGTHSALAYLGLAKGLNLVSEAIADPQLGPLAQRLMREEAASSFSPAPGQNLSHYADELAARFSNPALPHRLAQIAMDGSQKIPQRWLSTLSVHQEAGRETPAILQALASWVLYVRGRSGAVDDPMRDQLARAWQSAGHAGIAGALFGANGLFREHWIASEAMLEQLDKHIRTQLT